MTAFTLSGSARAPAGQTAGEAAAAALARVRLLRPARSGAVHRTGAPVRRDSVEAGTFEDMFFAPPAKGETDRLLRMARAALDAGRRLKRQARADGLDLTVAQRALIGITAATVRVYEALLTLARLNQGRVYPSYDHLAETTALGRATVARALAALEAAGFLVRQRRFARVDGNEAGPRYAQTSNAYRATLPRALLGLLPRWLRPAPLPDDIVQHAADHAEEEERMLGQLSCRELAETVVGGPLGRVLARLGAAVDACAVLVPRESHNDPQPLPDSHKRTESVGLSRPTRRS